MSNKVFNTRIQNKHGTEADWAQATNFTPLLGELIVYDVDENHSMQRIKIGDGVNNVNALPFVNTPDWNAKEGEEGHIKNRTHWVEKSLEPLVFPEGTWTTQDLSELYGFDCYLHQFHSLSNLDLVADEPYTVIIDGVELSATSYYDSEAECVTVHCDSSDSVLSFHMSNILPDSWLLEEDPERSRFNFSCYSYKNLQDSQISVYKGGIIYHRLDEKFLPPDLLKKDHNTSEDAHQELFGKKPGKRVVVDEWGNYGEVFNDNSSVGNRNAHAEGDYTKALGLAAHAEGANTVALGSGSHAEGFSYSSRPFSGTCDGLYLYVDENDKETLMSWLEDGILNTTRYEDLYLVISDSSNINLDTTYQKITNIDSTSNPMVITAGWYLPSEGLNTRYQIVAYGAFGNYSHAEGETTLAKGPAAHAEGKSTIASGTYSHAEGVLTTALGEASHAEGIHTKASGSYQHVQGKYNIEDTNNQYAHIVGNGNGNGGTNRSNAHTLDWEGNAWFAGNIKIGGIDQSDKNAKTLATTNYVDNAIAQKSQVQIITWEADD